MRVDIQYNTVVLAGDQTREILQPFWGPGYPPLPGERTRVTHAGAYRRLALNVHLPASSHCASSLSATVAFLSTLPPFPNVLGRRP
jgi:hypothetical protein